MKVVAALRRYVPGAGVVIDACTGKVIQDVVAASRPAVLGFLGLFMVLFACSLVFAALTGSVFAQTDINSTITTLNGYWTTVQTLAIGIILFVLGRRIMRKL